MSRVERHAAVRCNRPSMYYDGLGQREAEGGARAVRDNNGASAQGAAGNGKRSPEPAGWRRTGEAG